MLQDPFVLAGREYRSRLIVGTGKYKDFDETRRAIDASGAEIVTVALRRVNINDPRQREPARCICRAKRSRSCRTPRAATPPTTPSAPAGSRARPASATLVKLEVIGDAKTLFPDVERRSRRPRCWSKEGFAVLPVLHRRPDRLQASSRTSAAPP